MTIKRLCGAALAACLLFSAADGFAQNCQDKFKAAQASVVEIFVSGENATGTNTHNIFGSGFIVHSDSVVKETYILTAAHILNPKGGWAAKAVGPGPNRTIRVRIQKPDDQFELLSDDAAVIVEQITKDFAVLAIPQRTVQTLKMGSSSRVTTGALICMAGFPGSEHRYIGKTVFVRNPDLPNSRLVFDGLAEVGQSGGVVMDASGRAVAIIGANDDVQRPRYHYAVIVSEPADSLNDYLRKKWRPIVALEDSSAVLSRFRVVDRKSNAQVVLSGDAGDLKLSKTVNAAAAERTEVSAQGAGNEKSDCLPTLNTWISNASGMATVQPF